MTPLTSRGGARSNELRPKLMLRLLFRAPVILYRWRCGWLLGHRFLMLIHCGRRTGLRRRTVLEILEYRDDVPEAIVMSAYGGKADWLRNVEVTGQAEVVIGTRHFVAAHRRLGVDEATAAVVRYLTRNRLAAQSSEL